MNNVTNGLFKTDKQLHAPKRNILIACKLTTTEKQEFNKYVMSFGFKTPSEAIKSIIREALNNV